ncbi:ABC transporter ATP-binding protein [Chloroflexota bacterium]
MKTNKITIKVDHVSKKFCRYLRRSMQYGIQDIGRNLIGISTSSDKLRKDEFWAVNDVSFEVRRGETLGIIGPNGSGKSTLLMMLTGIFMPDKGKIEMRGRVGSLIAMGAGFHPMLTGRENIYINGAILGMNKNEIDEKFDDIVEFADIGDFLDTPVKNYSSGMQVRLGFAITANCEQDILLVDEVLAVGDLDFQRKCHRHIHNLKENGTAIILVSHSIPTIQAVCQRVLWLDQGRVQAEGSPTKVVAQYSDAINQQAKTVRRLDTSGTRFGTGEVTLKSVDILDSEGRSTELIRTGEPLRIRIRYRREKPVDESVFRIWIQDVATGTIVTMADSRMGDVPPRLAPEGTVECIFEPVQLRPRQYSVFVGVAGAALLFPYDRWGNATTFVVSSEGLDQDVTFIHGQPDLVALPYIIRHKPGDTE